MDDFEKRLQEAKARYAVLKKAKAKKLWSKIREAIPSPESSADRIAQVKSIIKASALIDADMKSLWEKENLATEDTNAVKELKDSLIKKLTSWGYKDANKIVDALVKQPPVERNTTLEDKYKEYINRGIGALKKEFKDVKEEELWAIAVYTTQKYTSMNALYRGVELGQTPKKEGVADLEDLTLDILAQQGLKHISKIKETKGRLLRRDLKYQNLEQVKYYAGLSKGTVVKDLAFVSSTTKVEGDENFIGQVAFIIKQTGLQVAADVAMLSAFPSESEVLFAAGTNFKVEKVEVDENQLQNLTDDNVGNAKSVVKVFFKALSPLDKLGEVLVKHEDFYIQ